MPEELGGVAKWVMLRRGDVEMHGGGDAEGLVVQHCGQAPLLRIGDGAECLGDAARPFGVYAHDTDGTQLDERDDVV